MGIRWSNNKSAWYKAPEGYKRQSRKDYSMDDIRGMYGSTTIKSEEKEDEKKTARAVLAH